MPQKCTVRLEPIGRTLEVNSGTPLIDLVHELGIEFPCGGKGKCLKCKVRIISGILEADENHLKLLHRNGLGENRRLACKSIISHDVTLEVQQLNTIILADNKPFSFRPGTGYGIAIDLGTTTIVAQLVELSTGHVLDIDTAMNSQRVYGSDIMSRITAALNTSGQEKLCGLIRDQIGKIIARFIRNQGIRPNCIVIVGNTVMHHLFSGIDVSPLAVFPFESPECGEKTFRGSELGWEVADDTRISFMPNLGSFVGSDILAGILATEMHTSQPLVALIDLGTNGEIAVGNHECILVASTAAGPAFEGTNISQGMHASTGAISSVALSPSGIGIHVIGNEKAIGICGSGLIDAIATCFKLQAIDETGQIISGRPQIDLTDSVSLSQKDIYEFILAKSAIAAGLQILLNKLKRTHRDVSKVYIAGGFGNFISVQNAIAIGLLEFRENQIIKMGNTALIGAKMMLFQKENLESEIIGKTEHVSLETNQNFQDIFIEKMTLAGKKN